MNAFADFVGVAGRAVPATRRQRLLILIYHRVHAQPDPMFPGEVDAARFEDQMRLLRRHCQPLPLLEAVSLARRQALPARAVAITFDDGYADNATQALPILQRWEVPATFFIATGFLDGGRMWNDTVIESIRRAPRGALRRPEFDLPDVALDAVSQRGPVADEVLRAVKHLHPADRLARVDAFAQRLGFDLPTNLMMSTAQVRQLSGAGMEIGAHTATHPILRTLARDEAKREIDASRQALEQITGQRIRAFAYPNGKPGDDYSRRDRDLVQALGFECALSTWRGVVTQQSDVFQLPRFSPWDRTPARWLARLMLAFSGPTTLGANAV